MKVAGAPITWGVCEVPGWGYQMSPERVLDEMAGLGLSATEMGPEGFLPTDATQLRDVLASHGLGLVAGFVPAVLHDALAWATERRKVERHVRILASAGAEMLVLAASTGRDGYNGTTELGDEEWRQLVDAIGEVERIAAEHGLGVSLHPHYGTVIEHPADVYRLLTTCAVGLCLDTGHAAVGGGDPVALVEEAAGRVTHVHLKDVHAATARRVRAGEVAYQAAVASGLYRPLGEGDLDMTGILGALERAGYEGWFVLEQDTVLRGEPDAGAGPVADAGASYRFLHKTSRSLERPG